MFRINLGISRSAGLAVSLSCCLGGLTAVAGAQPTDAGGSAALSSTLAILRQTQTPADVLPVQPVVEPALSPDEKGEIVPALSRLVGTAGQTSVYLEVLTPPKVPVPLWPPALGDQVALVAVRDQTATVITGPVPAIDLSDADLVGLLPSRYGDTQHYVAGIVPDKAVRVVWTFANKQDTVRRVVHVSPTDNVAITAVPAGTTYLLRANWYAADGTLIPNSTAPFRHAVAQQARAQRVHDLKIDEHLKVEADPTILKRFAVFGVAAIKGVKVGGLTISHPRISALPDGVLRDIARGGQTSLDPRQVREVTTSSGYSVWIIPGPHGLCVEDQSGGACATSATSALRTGVGFETGDARVSWHVMVYPEGRSTVTLPLANHASKTIRLIDGMYIYRVVAK